MTRIREVKTNFTAGEISRELLGRGDLRAYDNGALTLRNVFIKPTGGVTRRAGLTYIDTALGATHYHANYVSPHWAKNETPLITIGNHIFYRLMEV